MLCPLLSAITDHHTLLGTDTLTHQWPHTLLYAFPPVRLIPPTLDRARANSLSLPLDDSELPREALEVTDSLATVLYTVFTAPLPLDCVGLCSVVLSILSAGLETA